jgi:hypothetical protein
MSKKLGLSLGDSLGLEFAQIINDLLWEADFQNGVYTVAGEAATVGDIFDIDAGSPNIGDLGLQSQVILTSTRFAEAVKGAVFVVEYDAEYVEGSSADAYLWLLDGGVGNAAGVSLDDSHSSLHGSFAFAGYGGSSSPAYKQNRAIPVDGANTAYALISKTEVFLAIDGNPSWRRCRIADFTIADGYTPDQFVIRGQTNIQIKKVSAYSVNSANFSQLRGPPPPGETTFTADFMNGVYTAHGSPVTLDDVFFHNPDFGNWKPETQIQNGVGLVASSNSNPELQYFVAGGMADGFTIVVDLYFTTLAGNIDFSVFDDPAYNSNAAFHLIQSGHYFWFNASQTSTVTDAWGTGSGNAFKVAMTFVPGGIAVSIDGGAVETYSYDYGDYKPDAFGIWAYGGATIKTVSATPAVDDSELPALSA